MCLLIVVAMARANKIQFPDEWSIWKSTHSKGYMSEEVGYSRGGEGGEEGERGDICRCISQCIRHNYCFSQEEILRNTVWVANRKYIENHNGFSANKTGFTLAMNQFGDLVSY